MAIASLIISILSALTAVGSAGYARRMWVIERGRYHAGRQPQISAAYEDFGGHDPGLEITNDGNEDLIDVKIQLLDPLFPYIRVVNAISSELPKRTSHNTFVLESGQAGWTVDLGALAVSETKRIHIHRDDPAEQYGEVLFYANCSAADKSEWRVSIKADIPKWSPQDGNG
jgi:hypothetical protein